MPLPGRVAERLNAPVLKTGRRVLPVSGVRISPLPSLSQEDVALHASVLLVSGSTRGTSTNTAALRAMLALADERVTAILYQGMAELPAFNPDNDHDPLPPPVAALRKQIAAAAGVLFCTPEYAGALPGSFKNLLDWTVGGGEMDGKPVAWINVAAEGRGVNADASMVTVLGYLGAAVVASACRRVFVPRDAVGADGLIIDPHIHAQLADVLRAFVSEIAATDGS
jgi:chromate reductase, NAD(P)H dehydrogenase (quinone)